MRKTIGNASFLFIVKEFLQFPPSLHPEELYAPQLAKFTDHRQTDYQW